MKLNGISVEQFGVCKNVSLNDCCNGFNLVYGKNGSGKTTLANYVKNVFYGATDNNFVNHVGSLNVSDANGNFRLSRNSANQLVNLNAHNAATGDVDSRSLPDTIGRVGQDVFDSVFHIDGRNTVQNASTLVNLLSSRLDVPFGRNAMESSSNPNKSAMILEVEDRIRSVSRSVAELVQQRNDLTQQSNQREQQNSSNAARRSEIERALQDLDTRLRMFDLPTLQNQVASLDHEISELRLSMEHHANQIVAAPKPLNNNIAILYRRLDEVDNQIRLWRSVHTDVQRQRISLKDEMLVWNDLTLDSSTHPYHRSRALVKGIEATVGNAESTLHNLRNRENIQPQDTGDLVDHLTGLCGQIREDLYSLCDELGTQYKSIRHHNAAAELKRLRRCYHEIGDNIEFLMEQHQAVVEEIRAVDPTGAAAISRAENKFCECAQHHGYLEARRLQVGEFTTPVVTPTYQTESLADKHRLTELEAMRSNKVRQLVEVENETSQMESQRRNLIAERDSLTPTQDDFDIRNRLSTIQAEWERLTGELRSLENEKLRIESTPDKPACSIVLNACEYVQQLTNNRIKKVWLGSEFDRAFFVEDQVGVEFPFDRLGSGIQQQVSLAVCLAVVDHYRQMADSMPMILDDVFVNLDPELIQATFNTLDSFCQHGNQVIALTADQTVWDLARTHRVTVFDLPETSVSPVVPLWSPERMPQISPPESTGVRSISRDIPSDTIQATESFASNACLLNENSELQGAGIFSQDEIRRLTDAGISRVGQLLELSPDNLPAEFSRIGVSQSDIDRWQSQTWLLVCVPELHADDARILFAIGVHEPEQLESTHCQQLVDRISRYLNSLDSIRTSVSGARYNRDRINRWYDSLGRTRSRWRLPSGYSRRNRWRNRTSGDRDQYSRSSSSSNGQDSQRRRFNFDRTRDDHPRRRRHSDSERSSSSSTRLARQESRSDSSERRSTRSNSRSNRSRRSTAASPLAHSTTSSKLKFYLELGDQLEAAPSIGPKTAERFAKIGIITVENFLTQTAESMAPKINYKRITADVIRQWQHQARLVCRVPNLRGHDSQLLVACDIIEPEDLAIQTPEKLFSIIQPFATSKEGLKIIRSGKQPDLEEITDWISWAKQTRSLQAA